MRRLSPTKLLSRVTLGLLSVGAVFPGSAALAEPAAAPSAPSWAEAESLARHHFFYLDDRRGSLDRLRHSINPAGIISGKKFLELTQPLSKQRFTEIVGAQGVTESSEVDRMYGDYLKSLTQQGLAILSLGRILDHEAMKMNLPPLPSQLRVQYVAKSVLFENAVSQNKVRMRRYSPAWDGPFAPRPFPPPDPWVVNEDMLAKPNSELYGWLKEAVGDRPVRFNIDWTYRKAGLSNWLDNLKAKEFPWPKVALSFRRLPETYEEFESQVMAKLVPTHRLFLRQYVWGRHLDKRQFESMRSRAQFASEPEKAKLYEAMKEQAFAIRSRTASTHELVVRGVRTGEFVTRFLALLEERQKALLEELFAETPEGEGGQPDPDRLRLRIVELRKNEPPEIFEQVKSEFAEALSSGELEARLDEALFDHRDDQQLPADEGLEARQKRAVFNPMFESMALFPKFDSVSDSEANIVLLKEITTGEKSYLPISDRRVQETLRSRIVNKRQAFVLREAVLEKFRRNPLSLDVDTCSDPAWPCASTDAQKLAEALFPERLMVGAEAAAGAEGPTSSIGRWDLLENVAEISVNLFARAFETPNEDF